MAVQYDYEEHRKTSKSAKLCSPLQCFPPSGFSELVENFQNARDLEARITSFCTRYRTYCAEELFTFSPSFSKFNRSIFVFAKKERKEDFHHSIKHVITLQSDDI
jgi:5'-deoxynucleotidase YfbR-like HD superfamily hydrolase